MTGRFAHSDQCAVWQTAGEIAEVLFASVSAAALGQELMAAMDRLVECDIGSILSASAGRDWSTHGEKQDTEVIRRNHWRYSFELEPAELQQLSTSFVRDSDIATAARRERWSVYRDFIQPNRQSGYVARYWFMDGRAWGIGMTRCSPRFSEREIGRLNAIFPQLKAALRAGTWLAQDEDGLARNALANEWSLTPAEERVAALVVRGLTNREVAGLLSVSPNTVRNTLAQVFAKLGASRRSEVGFMLRAGTPNAAGQRPADRGVLRLQLGTVHTVRAASQPTASSAAR